ISCSRFAADPLPLQFVADVALSGDATRLDYESLDTHSGILYIAHMGDGAVIAFDTRNRKVIATIPGMPAVRGVLAVPQLHRVFAAAEGNREVAVIDMGSDGVIARLPAGDVDGLAYDPTTKRVFVSDESGERDVVIDGVRDRVLSAIPLGGEAGNTVYDENSQHILVAVQTSDELVEIDPKRMRIIARYPVRDARHSHGIALDPVTHFAYIAGEANATVVAFDLRKRRAVAKSDVGAGVDVLSVDPVLGRLYVASESGIVSVFDVSNGRFRKLGQSELALNAHVVAADAKSHLVYFPLKDVQGKPTLRIMRPQS
ncbi:MAG TPA: YncE family protein, partial [Candidatus Rubrimentiphilum sp.]|nr:YncE family protein [Candidatus Rubrimentiphilum sp.]